MLQNRFVESLKNIPGKGRLGGGMKRCSKLCPTNANVSNYGKQEETEMLITLLWSVQPCCAKTDAEKIAFKQINPRSVEIYRLAKQMRRENQDVIGDKPMRNNNGQMSLDVDSEKSMERALYAPFQCGVFMESKWFVRSLSRGKSSEPITIAMVRKAINKMSLGKAAGSSGIVAEVRKAAGSSGASMIRDLIEDIIFENRIPSEWQESHIVSVYK